MSGCIISDFMTSSINKICKKNPLGIYSLMNLNRYSVLICMSIGRAVHALKLWCFYF